MEFFSSPRSEAYDWLAATAGRERETWGDVLDAGTGANSAALIVAQRFETVTAVTASAMLRRSVEGVFARHVPPHHCGSDPCSVVFGNWASASLLEGRTFDTVVCDYLIGASESYVPFQQEALLARLLGMVRPAGLFLLTGLQPYELALGEPTEPVGELTEPLARAASEAGDLLLATERLKDAAIILADSRPFREFPECWARRQIDGFTDPQDGCKFEILGAARFGKILRAERLYKQLDWAEANARRVSDLALQGALTERSAQLRSNIAACRALSADGFKAGWNYALVARRKPQSLTLSLLRGLRRAV